MSTTALTFNSKDFLHHLSASDGGAQGESRPYRRSGKGELTPLWKYAICPRTVAPLCAPGGFAPTFPPPLPPWPWPMRLLRPLLLLLLLLLQPPVPLLQPRQVRARLRGRKRLQRCTGGTHGARQSLQHAPWQPCLQSRTFPQKSPIPPSPLPFICMSPLFPTTWKL